MIPQLKRDEKGFNKQAEWIKYTKEINEKKQHQEWNKISKNEFKFSLNKSHKWKSTSMDRISSNLRSIGESHKYLGVAEAADVVNEMKDKVKKEYHRRVRKVLETKLNSGNVFKAINNLGSISGEVLYSILAVVKTSTRGDWQEKEKVSNYAQCILY